jgi:prevent-host-death family protein
VATISQGHLRNDLAAVLRRAEQGERFIVTVAGRPVAELGPLAGGRAFAAPERLGEILAVAPPDPGFSEDLRQMRRADAETAHDGWAP